MIWVTQAALDAEDLEVAAISPWETAAAAAAAAAIVPAATVETTGIHQVARGSMAAIIIAVIMVIVKATAGITDPAGRIPTTVQEVMAMIGEVAVIQEAITAAALMMAGAADKVAWVPGTIAVTAGAEIKAVIMVCRTGAAVMTGAATRMAETARVTPAITATMVAEVAEGDLFK